MIAQIFTSLSPAPTWIFGVAGLILAGILGFVIWKAIDSDDPPID